MRPPGIRNRNQAISPIRMRQFTDTSRGHDVSSVGGVSITDTGTLAQFDSDMRQRSTRAVLFEGSAMRMASPDMTPIARAGNTTALTPGYDALTLNSTRKTGIDSPGSFNDTTGANSARAMLFADSRTSDGSRLGLGLGDSLSGTSSFVLGSSSQDKEDEYVAASLLSQNNSDSNLQQSMLIS